MKSMNNSKKKNQISKYRKGKKKEMSNEEMSPLKVRMIISCVKKLEWICGAEGQFLLEMLNGQDGLESDCPNLELDWIAPNPAHNRSYWVGGGSGLIHKYGTVEP